MQSELLTWFVLFAAYFAVAGFLGMVVRGFSARRWSNLAIVWTSAKLAIVAASLTWLVLVIYRLL